MFSVGLALASKITDEASIFQPAASIVMVLFALVLIVCFAIIAALLIVALVESYIVVSAGVLFMGFGGSKWTKDFALKILVYAVSVGAKLFVMQLLIGLGQQVFNALASNFETRSVDILVVIGSAIVMVALTWFLPELIQGMINGTAFGGNPAAAYRIYENTLSAGAGSLLGDPRKLETGERADRRVQRGGPLRARPHPAHDGQSLDGRRRHHRRKAERPRPFRNVPGPDGRLDEGKSRRQENRARSPAGARGRRARDRRSRQAKTMTSRFEREQ